MDRSESIDAIRHFNRTYVAFMRLLDATCLDTGKPLVETRVLFEIAERPGITAREVAETLHIDKGYLSRILKRCEGEGLITRATSARDGRARTLTLTQAGEQYVTELAEGGRALVADVFVGASDAQLADLAAHMQAIEKKLATLSG